MDDLLKKALQDEIRMTRRLYFNCFKDEGES